MLREYISIKPALQEILKGLVYKGEERPAYMLSTGDPPQNKRPIQAESERMENMMQTGPVTVENSMEFPQKNKNGTAF